MAGLRPIDPGHEKNRRDDEHADFEILIASGQVRDKTGKVISIIKAHNTLTALQRDEVYQAYCRQFKGQAHPPPGAPAWIERKAGELGMSATRIRDIINEGNGQWPGGNMQWWRGCSLPAASGYQRAPGTDRIHPS